MRVVMSTQVEEYGESQGATRYRLQLASDHVLLIWTPLDHRGVDHGEGKKRDVESERSTSKILKN